MNIFVRTSDPDRNVKISRAAVTLTVALPVTSFSLTNIATRAAMREARELAHAAGLTLRKTAQVAVSH